MLTINDVWQWIKKWWQLILGAVVSILVYLELKGRLDAKEKTTNIVIATQKTVDQAIKKENKTIEESISKEEKLKIESDIQVLKIEKKKEIEINKDVEKSISADIENTDKLGQDLANSFGATYVKDSKK